MTFTTNQRRVTRLIRLKVCPVLQTHRGFAEAVRLAEEVGVLEGGGASPELLRQVPVEALGGARRGRPTRTLPGLRQLQVLHLLGHDEWEVSAGTDGDTGGC